MKKIIISSLLILFTSNSFAIECFDTTEINVQSTGILSTNAPARFIVTDGNFKGYKIITNLNINNQNRLSNDVNDFKTNDNSTQNVFLMAPNGNHTEFSAKLIIFPELTRILCTFPYNLSNFSLNFPFVSQLPLVLASRYFHEGVTHCKSVQPFLKPLLLPVKK